jgi:hypothetical protein
LQLALEGEPHNPTMLSHLGDVYAKTGRLDLAAAQWEKSLSEWHRSLAGEYDAQEVASTEQKLANAKRGQARQQKPGAGTSQQ